MVFFSNISSDGKLCCTYLAETAQQDIFPVMQLSFALASFFSQQDFVACSSLQCAGVYKLKEVSFDLKQVCAYTTCPLSANSIIPAIRKLKNLLKITETKIRDNFYRRLVFTEIINLYAVDIYHVLGYTGAIFTGLILGILGGGGAMLSVPVLVYLFQLDASVATGYSLFLIGVTALSGTFQNIRKNLVDYKVSLYYGIPSIVSVYIVRRFLIHWLPDVIFTVGSYSIDKDHFILIFLSVVMFGAAYKMITDSSTDNTDNKQHPVNYFKLALYAVFIGTFLGIVGAGGGFLITPALVYFANLSMKKAIGTSLLLVSVNSFIGFAGDLGANPHFDWLFLFTFSGFSIAGVLAGSYFSRFINSSKLKKSFGWFILAMAVYIVIKETFLK